MRRSNTRWISPESKLLLAVLLGVCSYSIDASAQMKNRAAVTVPTRFTVECSVHIDVLGSESVSRDRTNRFTFELGETGGRVYDWDDGGWPPGGWQDVSHVDASVLIWWSAYQDAGNFADERIDRESGWYVVAQYLGGKPVYIGHGPCKKAKFKPAPQSKL
jgi:hypothetical protein